MNKIHRYASVMIVIIGQVLLAFYQPAQASTYKFAYAALSSIGEGRIMSIDPVDKTTSIRQIQMFPSEASHTPLPPKPSWVSPSGEWIALDDVWSSTNDTIRLVNTRSGITRDIGLSIILVISPAQEQGMVWSPDSKYLAFSSPIDESSGILISYVYSVSDARLIKLNVHQKSPLRFVWSNDSSSLVVQGGKEPITTDQSVVIDVVNVKTNTVEESVDLSDQFTYAEDMCNLQWSPDKRYLAFVTSCDVFGGNDGTEEVYLWDTQTNKIIQATSLTTQMFETLKALVVFGQYTLYWLSPTQLMIGMLVRGVGTQAVQTVQIVQTLVYNPADEKFSIFSAGKVQEISVNPVNGRWALSLAPSFEVDTKIKPVDAHVKIGNSSTSITSLSSVVLPDGSNFSWSPDGKMLAYQQTGSDSFDFVTDGAAPTISYTFSDSSVPAAADAKTAYILPIGWITG